MTILEVLAQAMSMVASIAALLLLWRQGRKLDADEERKRRHRDLPPESADVRGRDSDAA